MRQRRAKRSGRLGRNSCFLTSGQLAGPFGRDVRKRTTELARVLQPPKKGVEVASGMRLESDLLASPPGEVSKDRGPGTRP